MDQSTIIGTLREHEGEPRSAGVEDLLLFGSCARGTAVQCMSDIDLIAEFDAGPEYSLLDRVRLENRLADMLGAKVDLAPLRTIAAGHCGCHQPDRKIHSRDGFRWLYRRYQDHRSGRAQIAESALRTLLTGTDLVRQYKFPYHRGMSELVFEAMQEADGGFCAECLTENIFAEGDTWDELRRNVVDATAAFFFDQPRPERVRLHLVRDEVLSVA